MTYTDLVVRLAHINADLARGYISPEDAQAMRTAVLAAYAGAQS